VPILKLQCFGCGKKIEFVDKVGFREECEHCDADAHVCCNCEFYDETAYNMCREPSADVVKEKDRNNYCDYFQPSRRDSSGQTDKDNLLAAAEALFKKNSSN